MMNFKVCPRCHMEVAEERLQLIPAVCDCCGYVMSDSEENLKDGMEKSLLKTAVVISLVIVFGFMHLSSWGGHCLEVIPLKISDYTGMMSVSQMERLAQIGMDLTKHDLVERMYSQIAKTDTKLLPRLGKFQLSRSKNAEAAESYRQYFAAGGAEIEARYDFARALSEIGQIDEAAKNFDIVLLAKPGIRQVTVLQKYVAMLIKAERYDQAQKIIETVRRQDPTASNFMETEFKVISEKRQHKT